MIINQYNKTFIVVTVISYRQVVKSIYDVNCCKRMYIATCLKLNRSLFSQSILRQTYIQWVYIVVVSARRSHRRI